MENLAQAGMQLCELGIEQIVLGESVFLRRVDRFISRTVVCFFKAGVSAEPDQNAAGDANGSEYLFNLYAEYIQLGWMKHKLESRLLGDLSITSDTQMIPPLWQKAKKN